MRYYLITVLNDKEECAEYEALQFLTDKQINRLSDFKKSNEQKVKLKINFHMNLVYSYVIAEKEINKND